MRFLIFSIIALMSSVAQANEPTVTREFTLNKPFEMVIPLAQANAKILARQIGGEVISQSVENVSITLDFINKDHSVTIFRQKKIKVKIPGGETTTINYKEKAVMKLNQIVTTTIIAEENDVIQYSKSVIEFNKADNQTVVNMKMWIKIKDAKTFWVRVISRVKLKKFEEKLRDIVGDPLPEETEETVKN
jgi:hypothetical protein